MPAKNPGRAPGFRWFARAARVVVAEHLLLGVRLGRRYHGATVANEAAIAAKP
jgi:hypothetical protein